MTNSIMMEGLWWIKKIIISTGKHHPHHIIFACLLLISIISNAIMISHIGIPTFIDSFTHSEDYLFLSSDQFTTISMKHSEYAIIVQKESLNLTSLNEPQNWCYETTTGCYLIQSQTPYQNNSNDAEKYIGRVITTIPSTPFSVFSFEWWQHTIRLLDNVRSLKQ